MPPWHTHSICRLKKSKLVKRDAATRQLKRCRYASWRQAYGRSASKCQRKWPDRPLNQRFGLPEVLVAVHTSRLSCRKAGKAQNIRASLGVIWRIPANTDMSKLLQD